MSKNSDISEGCRSLQVKGGCYVRGECIDKSRAAWMRKERPWINEEIYDIKKETIEGGVLLSLSHAFPSISYTSITLPSSSFIPSASLSTSLR